MTLKSVAADQVIGAIDADTAVVTLTHVDYRSGRLPRHGGDECGGARGGRADGLGPVAQRRSDRTSTSTAAAATWRSAAATNT